MNELDSYEYGNSPASPEADPPSPAGGGPGRWAVALAVVAGVVVALVLGWFWFSRTPPVAGSPVVEDRAPAAAVAPAGPTPVEERTAIEIPELDASDVVVRELSATLSAHPQFAQWLVTEDLVRRFVVVVENIAEGETPRTHLGFMAPKDTFKSSRREDGIFLDPTGYRRYDTLTEVFSSLDSEGTAELFRRLEPLANEAYRELGYPEGRFEATVRMAAEKVLATPRIEGEVELEPSVRSLHFADERLEGLDPIQKQLLRFGPENVATIQAKVRALLRELDNAG